VITLIGYNDNIEKLALENSYFRQVLFTGKHAQLVVMSLKPLEEIGMEVHETVDQFFRFEKGEGKVVMNGEESTVANGSAVIVPAGTNHNIINTSQTEDLKLYTIYSPPNHPEGTIHKTKEEAMAAEEEHKE
jgi:mannose-6-phosphate isomerase-like protein (cupin superfamily)